MLSIALVALSSLVAAAPAAHASTPTLIALRSNRTTFKVGDEVDVQEWIAAGSEFINAVEADFTYPTGRLSLIGIDDTKNGLPVHINVTSQVGLIRLAGGSLGPIGITGSGAGSTVRFRATHAGSVTLCLNDDTMALDPAPTPHPVPITRTGASYVIGTASAYNVGCMTHDAIAGGAQHGVSIAGRGFSPTGGTVVTVSGAGVTTSKVAVVSSTQITVFLTLTTTAPAGYRDVQVTNAHRSYLCKSCLRIGPAPTATGTTPTHLAHGAQNQVLRVMGHFGTGTMITIPGVTVIKSHRLGYLEIDLTVNVPTTTSIGAKIISMSTPYDSSYGYYGRGVCATCFSVT